MPGNDQALAWEIPDSKVFEEDQAMSSSPWSASL